jgi:hypothetical protein
MYLSRMKKAILLISGLLLSVNILYAQSSPKWGLSATVQGSQYGVIVPIWLGEKFVLAPAIDFIYSDHDGTTLGMGLASRFYLKREALSPYYGARVGAAFHKWRSSGPYGDIIAGPFFGLEYFISDNLSIGTEAQANAALWHRYTHSYYKGRFSFNTATMVNVTIYF